MVRTGGPPPDPPAATARGFADEERAVLPATTDRHGAAVRGRRSTVEVTQIAALRRVPPAFGATDPHPTPSGTEP
jgi:hypothetical protein